MTTYQRGRGKRTRKINKKGRIHRNNRAEKSRRSNKIEALEAREANKVNNSVRRGTRTKGIRALALRHLETGTSTKRIQRCMRQTAGKSAIMVAQVTNATVKMSAPTMQDPRQAQ